MKSLLLLSCLAFFTGFVFAEGPRPALAAATKDDVIGEWAVVVKDDDGKVQDLGHLELNVNGACVETSVVDGAETKRFGDWAIDEGVLIFKWTEIPEDKVEYFYVVCFSKSLGTQGLAIPDPVFSGESLARVKLRVKGAEAGKGDADNKIHSYLVRKKRK